MDILRVCFLVHLHTGREREREGGKSAMPENEEQIHTNTINFPLSEACPRKLPTPVPTRQSFRERTILKEKVAL